MNNDSLYPVFAEKKHEDCIRPEMKAEWERLRSKDCTDCYTADAIRNFFPKVL